MSCSANQRAVRIGECMSDEEIFVELARRMKLPVGTESVEEVLDLQLARGGLDMTFAELEGEGLQSRSPSNIANMRTAGSRRRPARSSSTRRVSRRWANEPAPLTRNRRKARSPRPKLPEDYPLVLTTGARISYFFQLGAPADRESAQGPSPSDGGNPSRDGGTLRHHQGRLDVDRDEAAAVSGKTRSRPPGSIRE